MSSLVGHKNANFFNKKVSAAGDFFFVEKKDFFFRRRNFLKICILILQERWNYYDYVQRRFGSKNQICHSGRIG